MKVLYEFDIAWVGWECDSKGAIIERDDGSRYLTTRSTQNNLPAENNSEAVLADKIKEYARLLYEANRALRILRGEE